MCNLFVTTGPQSNSLATIFNIFIHYPEQVNYEISPIRNGLSDHNVQLRWIHNVDFHLESCNVQNIIK